MSRELAKEGESGVARFHSSSSVESLLPRATGPPFPLISCLWKERVSASGIPSLQRLDCTEDTLPDSRSALARRLFEALGAAQNSMYVTRSETGELL
jgi:hypothetical protein